MKALFCGNIGPVSGTTTQYGDIFVVIMEDGPALLPVCYHLNMRHRNHRKVNSCVLEYSIT